MTTLPHKQNSLETVYIFFSFSFQRKFVLSKTEKKKKKKDFFTKTAEANDKNKLLHEKKEEEKVRRIAFNKDNKPAEARAWSSAWWHGFQLTKQV